MSLSLTYWTRAASLMWPECAIRSSTCFSIYLRMSWECPLPPAVTEIQDGIVLRTSISFLAAIKILDGGRKDDGVERR